MYGLLVFCQRTFSILIMNQNTKSLIDQKDFVWAVEQEVNI